MKRILLMVIRNLIFVPYWWIKLCWYAAHTDDYPEEKKYTFLRHVDEHAIEGGNIHIDVHGQENILKENGFMFFRITRDCLMYWRSLKPARFLFL